MNQGLEGVFTRGRPDAHGPGKHRSSCLRALAVPALTLALALALAPVTGANAQEGAPFLILNQERLLTGSETGQALLEEEREARDALRAEARELEQAFEEEERRLARMRETMDPEEFRELADDFDSRVVEARQQQDERSDALVAEFDRRRRQFYAEIAPVLVTLLSRYGARAIFDESSVLLADQSLNITDAVIAEIDARARTEGEGGDDEAAPPAAPQAPEEEVGDDE